MKKLFKVIWEHFLLCELKGIYQNFKFLLTYGVKGFEDKKEEAKQNGNV